MTLLVNRLGAHLDNIEIEGTGVGMRWQSHNLPCVIFFDNTGVRFPLFSDKNNYAIFGVQESAYAGCPTDCSASYTSTTIESQLRCFILK